VLAFLQQQSLHVSLSPTSILKLIVFIVENSISLSLCNCIIYYGFLKKEPDRVFEQECLFASMIASHTLPWLLLFFLFNAREE
jgi:hypothetical protein